MSNNFHVGQKVVCIDDSGHINANGRRGTWEDGDAPKVGAIYTVRRSFTNEDGDAILWLDEIRRGPIARKEWGDDVGYGADRFRPVVERKTDISVFTAMLNPSKTREHVE